MRSLFVSRKRRRRVRPASPCGSYPSGSLLSFELEGRADPLPEEHRMMSLEHPLAGAVTQGSGRLVGFQLVKRGVVGQVQQDLVVEIPTVGDVVPAHELDPELLLVLLHLTRHQRLHEELEERVAPTTD